MSEDRESKRKYYVTADFIHHSYDCDVSVVHPDRCTCGLAELLAAESSQECAALRQEMQELQKTIAADLRDWNKLAGELGCEPMREAMSKQAVGLRQEIERLTRELDAFKAGLASQFRSDRGEALAAPSKETPEKCPTCGSDEPSRRDCNRPLRTPANPTGFHSAEDYYHTPCRNELFHGQTPKVTEGEAKPSDRQTVAPEGGRESGRCNLCSSE
jgi:hypothetical protein